MRYMLYESNTEKVTLEKEIEHLKSFLELQQLRIKQKNFIIFNVNGDISNKIITPMLLISFVENAFKHGSLRAKKPGIDINLTVDNNNLSFEVINYLRKDKIEKNDTGGGIGLDNIKRRLELLYQDKHKLDIRKDNNQFYIKLKLEI